MITQGKRRFRFVLPLFLCVCLVMQAVIYPASANDRSASIIGSLPLLADGIIAPLGLSGQGQLIGIADSGLDKGSMSDIHPDLQTAPGSMPKVILQSLTGRVLPDDPDGHGTFMAATVAGTGKASEGKYQGIAPGASLYFQALLDQNNNLRIPTDLTEVFGPAYSAGVRVHVNGWGNGSNSYGVNSVAIDRFAYFHRDFLPIYSAGNNGPAQSTLTTEANSKNALVIGSSQVPRPAFDTDARFSGQVSTTSSLGPTGDGRIKPDLLAPGSALISACSSLVESNFAANPQYTRMGGTSMAAAVTGGATALLREQLSRQYDIKSPSSALLKALLVNGARGNATGNMSEGFGIMDLAGTCLAVQEKDFKFVDGSNRIRSGEGCQYSITVKDTSRPIKVTLGWIDPPGIAGDGSALINNLDLSVQDPSGTIYRGNDFSHQGKVDNLNNMEKVTIEAPKTGTYKVIVTGGQMKSGGSQDFALVYGQGLKTGTVIGQQGSQLELADGSRVNLATLDVVQVRDGKNYTKDQAILEGSDIYLTTDKAYVFGQTWQTGGIQSLETDQGSLILEMNSQGREGGFFVDPQVKSLPGRITVNSLPVTEANLIPSGSELLASLNPFAQTLWKLEAFNQQVTGYVNTVNTSTHEIQLINDKHTYRLADWVAIYYQDKVADCSTQDAPYSASVDNSLDALQPGMAITMQVSPRNQVVQTILVERFLAIGKVAEVNLASQSVTLETGRQYQIMSGSNISRDRKTASLDEIRVGDLLVAQLLPGSTTFIRIEGYSQITYGRVVYSNAKKKVIYVMDINNQSHAYKLNQRTGIYGQGVRMDATSLNSGNWVRVITDPDDQNVLRIDVGQIGEESLKVLQSVDHNRKLLQMEDGTRYRWGSFTRFSQGGYAMQSEDLIPGETLAVTTLSAPAPWLQVLTEIEVQDPVGISEPDLSITASGSNDVLVVRGVTSADRLYIYRRNGNRERIDINQGRFECVFSLLDQETELTAVALDMQTGAIKDINVQIEAYTDENPAEVFTDISGHWAEGFINDLAYRKVVKGYEDGTFRPNQPIDRAELMVMIIQLKGIDASETAPRNYFSDQASIPWWALDDVLATRREGIIYGYPDGTFRPFQNITRAELAIIYANLGKSPAENLFPGDGFQPDRPVTRAEAAAILSRYKPTN